MSTISKKQLKEIRMALPYRYAELLKKRLIKEKISASLIRAVMNKQKEDYHGIIKCAIKLVKEIEAENQAVFEQAKELTTKK